MNGRNGSTTFLALNSKIGGQVNNNRPSVGQLDKIDDTNGETNPYKELIVNNAEKLEPLMTQMEQWSILSNVLKYIQNDKHPKNYHDLRINAINKYKNSLYTSGERDIVELDFSVTPKILWEEYLDVYKGIQSEVVKTTRVDEIQI